MTNSYLKLSCIGLIACVACRNPNAKHLSEKKMESKKDNWVVLFDGKSTKGWHTYGKSTVSSSWKVEDETLHLTKAGGEGGDLITDREFENYHLKIDWKISQNGNSGIFLM